MEETKVFDQFLDLPDGYQVQLMVMAEPLTGSRRQEVVYRSRIWLGHESEMDPMLHRSQVRWELEAAIDACYSMLVQSAPHCFESVTALQAAYEAAQTRLEGLSSCFPESERLTEGAHRARMTLRSAKRIG